MTDSRCKRYAVRMTKWLGRHWLFLIVFAAVSAFALLPIWTIRYLPLLDWPQHMSLVHVLRHYYEPTYRYWEYLVVEPRVTDQLTFLYGAELLSYLMSVEAACRVMVSLYVLGLPLSLMAALRAFGRNPWCGFLGFPLVYSYPLYMGFIPYCLSIPLLFLGIALWEALLSRPTRLRMFTACLHGPLLFFTHSITFVIGLGITVLLLLAHEWRRPVQLLKRGALLLVGMN